MAKIQWVLIGLVIAYFSTLGTGLSAAYGGLISLLNTGLINKHINKQKAASNLGAGGSVRMMVFSVVIRMTLVAGLMLIGGLLNLDIGAVAVGLVVGLIGFLMDRVRQG